MSSQKKNITVFEHETLSLGSDAKSITQTQLEALQGFYGEKGVPYYSLTNQGVKFNEYVGVIQVGSTSIEVLPKADKTGDANKWRSLLISMMRTVGLFSKEAPSSSNLRLRPNSILDLYFELYISEVEGLIRKGLIKKYRRIQGNCNALKGSINFSKHISKNLIHQERFFVNYTTYDHDHLLHAILLKALKLLSRINSNHILSSRINVLLINFPELKDIQVSESVFNRIITNRKTSQYSSALDIARLILLNYHPDVISGRDNILALMFNMNMLWEKFVYVSLRKHKPEGSTIHAQNKKYFWKPENGSRSSYMEPDIVLNKGTNDCLVIDTKWKNIGKANPSSNDLRQIYVYMKYYGAKKVALVYPGVTSDPRSGNFYKHNIQSKAESDLSQQECSVISISVEEDTREMQKSISEIVSSWGEAG